MTGAARREPGLDALRTLAVLGMMSSHTSRMISFAIRPAWCYDALLFEPLIPTLFLMLVGVSLTYSLAKAPDAGAWYRRQARRAVGLWLISAVFFSLEENVRWPDVLVSSGILCTIAFGILGVGLLVRRRRPAWWLGAALAFGVAAFCAIDRVGGHPFLWVSGDSPWFPLLLFTLAGALWGLAAQRAPRIVTWLILPGLAAALYLPYRYGWEPLFTAPLGRSDAARLLAPPLFGRGAPLHVGYYNLRPLLALQCLGAHVATLGLGRWVRLPEAWCRRFFALGRHALGAYILHLFLLALIVVRFGMQPLHTAWLGDTVLLGVAATCWAWALAREHGWLRYRRGTQSSTPETASRSRVC